MNTFKRLITLSLTGLFSFPFFIMAQDEGTYIDELGVQDSSYMEQDFFVDAAGGSGSGTAIIIIVLVVIVVAALAYIFLKKKKKGN
jgi:hypothetical protein